MKAPFRDRAAAGRALARLLERYRGSRAVVLAIPSGGVPVAAEIARALSLPLDAVPVSKALLPWTTESGYGAVAFDGSVWIDEEARFRWNLTQAQIDDGIAAGSTMRTAIAALRTRQPAEIVVAVPTAHDRSVAAIGKLADAVVCANVRGGSSFAVADAYELWSDVEENDVAALLGL